MEKLVGVGNQGQFVLDNQVLATEDGFSKVNKSWFERTLTLDQGIDSIVDQRRSREDINCSISEIDFRVSNGEFVVEMIDGREYKPTEKALFDIAYWCDQTSISFVKRITSPAIKQNGKIAYERDEKDAETLCNVLKNGKRRIEKDKKFLFRTYNDGSLRCMLSDKYAIIDNLWVMEVVKEVLPGGRLSHWKGNEDNIMGNILIPDTIREEFDSDYGALVNLFNSETGEGRLSQLPALFRAICFNGCIHNKTEGQALNKVHRGKIDLSELRKLFIQNIHNQIPIAKSLIDKMMNTRQYDIGLSSPASVFVAVSDGKMAAKEIIGIMDEFISYESGERNLFGIVNSITRFSQTQNPNRWVELDNYAGSLLDITSNKWDRIINKANSYTSEEIDSYLGV